MQVVNPIDVEDALRSDLAALDRAHRYLAPPVPPDLRAGDVLVTRVGGARASAASHQHDVSVDCYAAGEAEAAALAGMVCGLVAGLPLRRTSTQYSNANAGAPYSNPDPRAPQLARHTFRAALTCPGTRQDF